MAEEQAAADQQDGQPQFAIQRVYLKDTSWESPSSPGVFLQEWKPEANVDLNTENDKLDDGIFNVVLTVTVTAKLGDKVAFIAEVKQGGIFTVKDFPEENIDHVLRSFCPNILFPYARQMISTLVSEGGFPQFYLNPINFDMLYEQQQAEGGEKH